VDDEHVAGSSGQPALATWHVENGTVRGTAIERGVRLIMITLVSSRRALPTGVALGGTQ